VNTYRSSRPARMATTPAVLTAILAAALGLMLAGGAAAHRDAGHGHRVSILVIDADSYLVNEAIESLDLPAGTQVQFFILEDLQHKDAARAFVEESDAVILDVMGVELTAWVLEHLDPAVHRIYALRGSRDDDALRRRGLIFEEAVKAYFDYLSVANIRNLIYRVIHREIDNSVTFGPIVKTPTLGIYHPAADAVFRSTAEYMQWYRRRAMYQPSRPWVGLTLFSSNLIDGQRDPFDYIIRRLEGAGLNVMACFGRDGQVIEQFLLDDQKNARVWLVLAFTLKFYSAVNQNLRRALLDLNVPVLDAINLYSGTIDQWRRDPIGIQPVEIVWTIAVPEMSGVGEPTPLVGKVKRRDPRSGKTVYVYDPIKDNVDRIIARIKGWLRLRRKPAPEKRLAVLYYNHNQGKQNINASYLNVFKSLEAILARLKHEGYRTGEATGSGSEADIEAAILRSGRNIGSWAPGELEDLLATGRAVRLPLETYRKWFDALPEPFRRDVLDQWGPPESARIMVKDGHLIIPAVVTGNLVLLPEPARGWVDAPLKLYHDATLYPHHQYIAVYLWLKYGFEADAVIHLGTHATHEWLPGKQAGLARSDSPEVLITDLPNIYPYIVDNVGEGLQAKRRGRGIVVDHLVPPLRSAGLYHEYAELLEMITAYNRAVTMDSKTAQTQLQLIRERIRQTRIDQDFHPAGDHTHGKPAAAAPVKVHQHSGQPHTHSGQHLVHRHVEADGRLVVDAALLHELEHHLHEIKSSLMPYGLHAFGRAPQGAARAEMAAAIVASHPEQTTGQVELALAASGRREMDHLIRALRGEYVPPAEGGDPIRNVKSIPTGSNFFGFSPDKVPSRAAWEMGRQAAEQIIARHLDQEGAYPQKVAVILWATETIRNEGINESTILYLLGLAPQWDRTGRITGTRVIAGRQLKRPRIDVLVNPSGLYRDLFPHLVRYIDDAIRTAAAQTDIENLISAHDKAIKARLLADGMPPAEAEAMAAVRIFTEAPGTYGTGVSEVTSASSLWSADEDIVKVYQNRVGHAFSRGMWGRPAQKLFRQNLKRVDVALHSRTSQLYGLLDNDDMYQYLGGLSMAVKQESGSTPTTLITDQRTPGRLAVEDVARTLGREMRVRYVNPRWIEGMKKENYAGAGQMANFVENLWGWQVTTPAAVDPAKWEQTFAVYVDDKYGLELKSFFNRASPWAYQSLTGRMLEAVRKKYWQAAETIQKKLAVNYAVSVIEKGVACCDHTCNNPFLNQMVVNILSLPGVMAPARIETFKLAIQKATAASLADQAAARQQLQKALAEGFQPRSQPQPAKTTPAATDSLTETSAAAVEPETVAVDGYKLKDMTTADETTELTTSGVQWFAGLALMGIIALFFWGALRRNKKTSVTSGSS